MEWFTRLPEAAQVIAVFGTTVVLIILVVEMFRTVRRFMGPDTVITQTTTNESDDGAGDALTDLALSYNITRDEVDKAETWDAVAKNIKKRVQAMVGTTFLLQKVDPFDDLVKRMFGDLKVNKDEKKEGPKLTTTRYYVRRGDGLFYDSINYGVGDFKSKRDAAWWGCPLEAGKVRDAHAIANPGLKFQVVSEEVTA